MKKIISFIAIMLCAALMLCGCTTTQNTSSSTAATVTGTSETPIDGSFRTSILNVGKADAIVLKTENRCVVIDAGEKGDGKAVLAKLAEYGVSTVDYLFITHFDQDHVGGAAKVINNMSIGQIITPNYEGNNSEYTKFIEACAEHSITPTRLTETMTITLDDVTLEVYPPLQSSYSEDDNDYSLVIKATHGSNVMLFTGDAESERLSELSGQIGDLSAAFLKVPHHGRYSTGLDTFIKAVSPKYAVITCSEDEGAEDKVLSLLSGANTFLTTGGDIEVVSNGKEMSVTQTPASTASPSA